MEARAIFADLIDGKSMKYLRVGVIGIVVLTAAVAADAADMRADKVDFNRQIRPLLSDKCFRCHGPDAHKRQADLRLDTAAGATADLGGRQAIVSGKADESELVARITSTDAAERMPPPDSGKTLSPEEIALLQQWVNE